MSLDLTSFEAAIAQLERSLDMHGSKLANDNPELKECLRGSAIQAFEFTYEIAFKMIKRHIRASAANPRLVDEMTFGGIIREAYGKNIIRSDISAWSEYRKNRGITGHTYNEAKANAVLKGVPDFLDEARYMLSRLHEMNKLLDRPD